MACGIKQAFVCKKQYDNTIPITYPQTTPTEGGCPSDWYRLGSMCYHTLGLSTPDKLSWEDARTACQQYPGGELASIHYQGVQGRLSICTPPLILMMSDTIFYCTVAMYTHAQCFNIKSQKQAHTPKARKLRYNKIAKS